MLLMSDSHVRALTARWPPRGSLESRIRTAAWMRATSTQSFCPVL